jgi:hypothetical protein
MTTPFPTWPDVAADLVAVAARRAPADTVIRNCAWVSTIRLGGLVGARSCWNRNAEGLTTIYHSSKLSMNNLM